MRKAVATAHLLAALTALFVLILPAPCFAQERSQIKVKRSDIVTGVVVVQFTKGKKDLNLQCNDGQPSCNPLKPGDYWLVELPENHGMYDCKNAEIYPPDKDPGDEPDQNERLGAYCLYEK